MCFELSQKSTRRVILSSAASAAVAGGSWKLVYPTSGRGVSYQSIALLVLIAAVDPVSQNIPCSDKTSAFKDKLIRKF